MKKIIEKFYDKIFADEEEKEVVPYANKVFMFYFSIVIASVIVVLITLDIIKNIKQAP